MKQNDCNKFKDRLVVECERLLEEKIALLDEELKHLLEDIAEETKSSAGDKFETGREMMNAEQQTLLTQVEEFKKHLAILVSLPNPHHHQVDFGNLLNVGDKWIFIAVGLGIIKYDNQDIMVISPLAPLGKLFIGKTIGEQVTFNGTSYTIKGIC